MPRLNVVDADNTIYVSTKNSVLKAPEEMDVSPVENALLGAGMDVPVFQMPDDHITASASAIIACTELAATNAHPRDLRLRFQAEGHSYFWDDRLVDCSAPWLHRFSVNANSSESVIVRHI